MALTAPRPARGDGRARPQARGGDAQCPASRPHGSRSCWPAPWRERPAPSRAVPPSRPARDRNLGTHDRIRGRHPTGAHQDRTRVDALARRKAPLAIVHTGQHYSYQMDAVFFEELGLPPPFANLEVGSAPAGLQLGTIIIRAAEALAKVRPDWVLVQGDTNSVLGGALAAHKLGLPIAHLEAGLRSDDWEMPRRPTASWPDGSPRCTSVPPRPARAAQAGRDRARGRGGRKYGGRRSVEERRALPPALDRRRAPGPRRPPYGLVTLHRPSNVDSDDRLRTIMGELLAVAETHSLRLVFPIHPRTRATIARMDGDALLRSSLRHHRTGGLHGFLASLADAQLVLTDSGGVQEEACTLRVPCVTIRANTERPETVDVGANMLCDLTSPGLLKTDVATMLGRPAQLEEPFRRRSGRQSGWPTLLLDPGVRRVPWGLLVDLPLLTFADIAERDLLDLPSAVGARRHTDAAIGLADPGPRQGDRRRRQLRLFAARRLASPLPRNLRLYRGDVLRPGAPARLGRRIGERATRICRWLCRVQNPDGSISNPAYDASKGIVFDTGQVLHGLVRGFEETGDAEILRAAEKAGDWLTDRRRRREALDPQHPQRHSPRLQHALGLGAAAAAQAPAHRRTGSGRRAPTSTGRSRRSATATTSRTPSRSASRRSPTRSPTRFEACWNRAGSWGRPLRQGRRGQRPAGERQPARRWLPGRDDRRRGSPAAPATAA